MLREDDRELRLQVNGRWEVFVGDILVTDVQTLKEYDYGRQRRLLQERCYNFSRQQETVLKAPCQMRHF